MIARWLHPARAYALVPLFTVLSLPAAAGWYDPAWTDRVELSAIPSLIEGGGPLTDISLVVPLDGSHFAGLFAGAQADGKDLLVTGGDGVTPWEFELVSYDPGNASGELWVRAPELSTTDNVFYLYFGNSDPLVSVNPGEAFGNDYLAVYHFAEEPGNGVVADSGPGANFALEGAGSTWDASDHVAGQVGLGWFFDGDDDWLYTTEISSTDSSFTVSAWFANAPASSLGCTAMQSEVGYWNLSFQRNAGFRYPTIQTGSAYVIWNPELPNDELHHYAWVLDGEGDVARFYFDGVEQTTFHTYAPNPPHKPYTGSAIAGRVGIAGPVFHNPLDLSDGVVDEYRIVEGLLSAEQIRTEYNNQSLGIDFFTCEFQQNAATPTDPALPTALARISVWPNPFQGVAQIDISGVRQLGEIAVYDLAGRRVRTLRVPRGLDRELRLQWDGRDENGEAVSGGVYFLRAQSEQGRIAAKLLLVR